jgi:hypothetical protein
MAKMTLLEMVQETLSDMNSDNVTSISDTIESMQVARIFKTTFMNLYNDRSWPTNGKLFRLESVADSNRPTHMRMAENVQHIDWVKYNVADDVSDPLNFIDIRYLLPADFLNFVMARNSTHSYAETVFDFHGTPLIIYNDRQPTYYTTFDDEYLVFDSFDSDMDSVLQASKTQVFGTAEPEFVMDDAFVPDIPMKAFPYFLAEAKKTAFLKVKEVFSASDAETSTRQKAWLSRNKRRAAGGVIYPDYGRRSGRGPSTPNTRNW